jgi:Bacterial pre-peptidase C-terminal domain
MPKIHYAHFALAVITAQIIVGHDVRANPRTKIEPIPKFEKSVYAPIQLPTSGEAIDQLSDRDIPTGDGGFARDYAIKFTAGDNIAIDLTSEAFDPVVILLNAEGKNIAKNDDGSDGTSNSLLFTRIKKSGTYVIRVQGFGETSSGEFKLKVSKLR